MANTVIALKKSSVPTAQPTVLANGELAINYADGKLFYKHANGTILPFNTQGGNAFGTINANGTLVVAGSSEAVVSIIAGNNISIVGDAINDKITISATGGGANVEVSTSQIKDLTSNDYVITSVTPVSQVVDSALMSAAFDKANVANTIAIAAFDAANASGGSSSAAAFDKANSANIVASLAFDKANSANVLVFNTGIGANAFTSATISGANTAVGTGANAFTSATVSGANTAVGAGANAFTSATISGANTAVGAGANAFTSATISGANTAVGTGANAFTSATVSGANTAVGTGANAFTSATVSGANTVAIAAFDKANSALANSTGTFSGNLTLTGSVNARSGIISTANNTVGSLGQALLSSGSGTYWGTISASSSFPAGTVMLFVQTAAPTGWTKSTTHNDKALRVVSGTASSGGSVAFSTAFASQSVSGTVGSTTLATTQIPSHTHTGAVNQQLGSLSAPEIYTYYNSTNTGATGGGQSHNHTFTGTAINLAVNYVDVIIATKD